MTVKLFPLSCLTLVAVLSAFVFNTAHAQDEGDAKPATPAAQEAPEEEADPYAVPDGNAEELFAFIQKMKRTRATPQTIKQIIFAAIGAAEKIRKIDGVSLEDEMRAIREQMGALAAAVRYEPTARKDRADLLKELENDKREPIVRLVKGETLKARIGTARVSTKEDLQTLCDDVIAFVKSGEIDATSYTLAAMTGRALAAHPEMAADFYETAAALMKKSDNEQIQLAAEKMLGSARRMKLPGNFMEIKGTTAEGEAFDWAAYRGKIVLVDFWASWCGPCRAEVPNMKKALEKYGDKGFDIVGINLDNTKAAYDKYVKDSGISWVSLMSDKQEERGWNNPLATYYGVNGIPTAILVDKEGKVVSMSARGPELERLLAEMLGPAEGADTEEGAE